MEENQVASGQPTEPVSDIQPEQKQDTVKYETYRKTVGEVKSVKSKLAEKEALIEQLQREKMEAEGDKDAKLEYYAKKLNETESKLNDLTETLEFGSVSRKVEQEALNQGCVDTTALMTLFTEQDWKELRAAGDDLDNDDVQQVLERVKTKYSKLKLFEKPKANVNVVNPVKPEPKKQKSYSEMTREELLAVREDLKRKGVG